MISKLRSRYKVGKETAFKYLGMDVSQDENNSVTLSQEEYISSLKQAEVRSEDKKELLSVAESDSLRSKIGQLSWLLVKQDQMPARKHASLETSSRMKKLKT